MNEHNAPASVSLSRPQTHSLAQLNDEEFWHHATEVAKSASTIQQHIAEYLICDSGAKHCILPLASICEIVPPPHQLTLLPSVPFWMAGMVGWRGEMIAVIDLRAYLWSGTKDSGTEVATTYQRVELLLIVRFQEIVLGLMVVAVDTLTTFDKEYMIPLELAPDWSLTLRPGVIRGILDDALVLDIAFIFNDIVQQIKEYQSL